MKSSFWKDYTTWNRSLVVAQPDQVKANSSKVQISGVSLEWTDMDMVVVETKTPNIKKISKLFAKVGI